MIIHIVKNNETIDDIINAYHVSIDEIRINNSHVTDFRNLVGGIKLRIPIITEETEQILSKTEGFIASYYNMISDEIADLEEILIEKKEEKIDNNDKILKRNDDNFIKKAYPGIIPPKMPYKGR